MPKENIWNISTGKFTNFSGEVNFDPDQLSESNVKIIVNVGSISARYEGRKG